MSVNKTRTYSILLIILSTIILMATLSKVILAAMGDYGNALFLLMDTISSGTIVPWLLVFIVFLRVEQTDAGVTK